VRGLADVENRRVWSVGLGEGYAGAAILNGRAYVLDYDQQAKADTLRCLSVADGKEIWRRGYYVQVKRNHGMSRTVPAVTDEYVVTIGPKCHVMCARPDTGEFLWGMDLVSEYDTVVPDWYAGQCPLIDEGKVIIAPAGRALMIAIDCETGRVVWETPNPHGWRMTHSSVMPMVLAGRETYVYCASGGVAGVSAADGRILWHAPEWTVTMANTPSPVILPDDRVFLSGGYGAGSMMIHVLAEGDTYAVKELFRLTPEQFGSEQQTPILYRQNIYGVREDGQLVCLDLEGRVVWTSGKTNRFGRQGRGPLIVADGMLMVMTGDGELALVEAEPTGFEKLASAQVLHEGESWGPMALSGGMLVIRDLVTMVCLDMRSGR
jgi:outer membrane protein assembly factor BamB